MRTVFQSTFSTYFLPFNMFCKITFFFSQVTSQLGRHTPYGFLVISLHKAWHATHAICQNRTYYTNGPPSCLFANRTGFLLQTLWARRKGTFESKDSPPSHLESAHCTDRRTKRLKMSLRSEHPPFFGGNTAWQIFKESRYLTRSCVRYGHRRDCGVLVCAIFC